MKKIPSEIILYPSSDSVNLSEDSAVKQLQIYLPKFLRSLKILKLLSGELKLKLGIPIILLQNLNLLEDLYNGTKLICHAFQSKVIDAEIITESHVSNIYSFYTLHYFIRD